MAPPILWAFYGSLSWPDFVCILWLSILVHPTSSESWLSLALCNKDKDHGIINLESS